MDGAAVEGSGRRWLLAQHVEIGGGIAVLDGVVKRESAGPDPEEWNVLMGVTRLERAVVLTVTAEKTTWVMVSPVLGSVGNCDGLDVSGAVDDECALVAAGESLRLMAVPAAIGWCRR